MTRVSNPSGGAAAAGGFGFQANLGAIAGVHTLRGMPVQWTDGLSGAAPCAVSFETSGPGDDLSLELTDGSIVEIQAKKGLRADGRFWSALDALCEGIHCDRCSYGILIVCPNSSFPVRRGYALALERIGNGRNDGASPEQRKLAGRLAERGYNPETVCARIRIKMVSALEDAGDAIAAARAELGHVCAADRQVTSAWHALCQDALLAIATKGRRTLRSLSERLRAFDIDIEDTIKDSPPAISDGLTMHGSKARSYGWREVSRETEINNRDDDTEIHRTLASLVWDRVIVGPGDRAWRLSLNQGCLGATGLLRRSRIRGWPKGS